MNGKARIFPTTQKQTTPTSSRQQLLKLFTTTTSNTQSTSSRKAQHIQNGCRRIMRRFHLSLALTVSLVSSRPSSTALPPSSVSSSAASPAVVVERDAAEALTLPATSKPSSPAPNQHSNIFLHTLLGQCHRRISVLDGVRDMVGLDWMASERIGRELVRYESMGSEWMDGAMG
ncbi:hypothetical protein VTL71DRAFT_15495 [Oculimacula yallundae]|uniref:Uncharacterized protein n=1 Tax=Oculimacula yallundae TaxID=86028 RepID=A0ABR4CGS0_9HELO